MEIYFDGYCPESLLKGIQVEMRLNEDDFWESEATGLQMTVFPPFATILRWRGKGRFKKSSDVASNSIAGLVITESRQEEGKEIFPDEKNLIENNFDLEWYLPEVYKSWEEFEAAKLNLTDPVFKKQEEHLAEVPKEDLKTIVHLFGELIGQPNNEKFLSRKGFQALHKMLYDLNIIFDFNWKAWHIGWQNLNDESFDYTQSTTLELSMYLTAIFRADRFAEGTIEMSYRNGTLEKLFNNLA